MAALSRAAWLTLPLACGTMVAAGRFDEAERSAPALVAVSLLIVVAHASLLAASRPGGSVAGRRIGLLCGWATVALGWSLLLALLLARPLDAGSATVFAAALAVLAGAAMLLSPAPVAAVTVAVLPAIVLAVAAERPPVAALVPLGGLLATILLSASADGRMVRRAGRADRHARRRAEALDAMVRSAGEAGLECAWTLDAAGRVRSVSDGLRDLPAPTLPLLRAHDWHGWVAEGCHQRGETGRAFRELRRAILRGLPFRRIELPIRLGGAERWVALSGWPDAYGDGAVAGDGFRGILSDVTASRASDARLHQMASRDPVTELPNRAVLLAELDRLLGDTRETCLVLLDLDGLKHVNEEHGLAVGDRLLRAVAGRLGQGLRAGDMAARVGPAEFAIVCRGTPEGAVEIARRTAALLAEPFSIGGITLLLGAEAGVASALDAGPHTLDLLHAAELALRMPPEQRSPGPVRVFEPGLREAARDRNALRLELREALEAGALALHFQPIVDAGSGRIVSCEALARWHHPTRGVVPPSVFIPLAEQSGLIGRLGEWALGAACREAATWPDGISVAVNVSALQLRRAGLLHAIDAALASSGLSADRLELELTETAVLDDAEQALPRLADVRARGIRIALDDFGTAYASLATLLAFRFDRVKIDRSFTRDIDAGGASVAIVRSILDLADGLGMSITAEGVENAAQLRVLRALGCPQAQGFLFSRPLPASEVRTLLAGAARGADALSRV